MSDKIQKDNSAAKGISGKYALVVVDVKGLKRNTFSYKIPQELISKIKTGSPVIVPFGHQNAVNGFVVGFSDMVEKNIKVRDIIDISDEEFSFSPEYMQLLIWTARYYICDLNSVIQAFMPSKLFGKYKTKVIKICDEIPFDLKPEEKIVLDIFEKDKPVLSSSLRLKLKIEKQKYLKIISKLKYKGLIKTVNLPDDNVNVVRKIKYIKLLKNPQNNTRYQELAAVLSKYDEIELSVFIKQAKTTMKTLEKMEKENIISIYKKEIFRNPLKVYENLPQKEPAVLSAEQQKVYDFICKKFEQKSEEPVLLHGVTASGKTEVYFSLIDKVIKSGKNVLFLAPEIALASMLTRKTVQRFGIENVGLWHSFISDAEKNDVRELLKRDKIRILIGARSAVFAPLKNIGMIIIDEEHESSYKQVSPQPYYSAVEVCEKLAKIHGALLLKGSATPDVCSYYAAKQTGNLTELLTRYNNVPVSPVTVIDMKEEYSEKGQKKFSTYLISKIRENLENKKQTILLINRLGYATKIQCTACGEILKCPKCGIPLIYHKSQKIYKCNWCDYEKKEYENCPCCGEAMLKYYGSGVEKIEEVTQKLFPSANIARLDSEALKGKYSHAEILKNFEDGKIDILIGTQMTAKGLDNPNVTLVGVVNSDNSFVFPDFRSSERGFQLLTQVAGRSGRGDNLGEVIFQTFNPDFSVIQYAKEQNYKKFYDEEITLRKEFGYPPFSQVVRIVVRGKSQDRTSRAAEEISLGLTNFISGNYKEDISVSQAYPCAFERIDEFFRYEILIKNFAGSKGHSAISKFYRTIKMPLDIQTRIYVSPLDLL